MLLEWQLAANQLANSNWSDAGSISPQAVFDCHGSRRTCRVLVCVAAGCRVQRQDRLGAAFIHHEGCATSGRIALYKCNKRMLLLVAAGAS